MIWYGVRLNEHDTDWGFGSYDLEKAQMAAKAFVGIPGYNPCILMMVDNPDPECIGVIYEFG